MHSRFLPLLGALLLLSHAPARACCALGRLGEPVVNADQTVLLIWDPATKTEHFIRKASFKAEGGDFGFLVPTPSRPQLSESGNAAFPALAAITRPRVQSTGGPSFSCSAPARSVTAAPVRVIEEKEVAGFHATVLAASSATALTGWLKTNGYHYSPEVEAWAAPYIRDGWMLTALRVSKRSDAQRENTVQASALRISFHTERPIFPYREPDSRAAAKSLGTASRLLRLYFISDARYEGALDGTHGWSGKPVWSGGLGVSQKDHLLDLLNLPSTTGPATWWLTEFEDRWPYGIAAGDLYFARAASQEPLTRWAERSQRSRMDLGFAGGLVIGCVALMRRRTPVPK
jgi:hypothetical protein